jgi:hypothetical protein
MEELSAQNGWLLGSEVIPFPMKMKRRTHFEET